MELQLYRKEPDVAQHALFLVDILYILRGGCEGPLIIVVNEDKSWFENRKHVCGQD